MIHIMGLEENQRFVNAKEFDAQRSGRENFESLVSSQSKAEFVVR